MYKHAIWWGGNGRSSNPTPKKAHGNALRLLRKSMYAAVEKTRRWDSATRKAHRVQMKGLRVNRVTDNRLVSCEDCIRLGYRDLYGTCETTCPDRRTEVDNVD
jgi:hypothetical protein